MCDSCNFCDFIMSESKWSCINKKPTSVISVTYVISQKNIHVPKIRDRNMCDLCNLCDFIIIESKSLFFNKLTNKCDCCNLFDFSKNIHLQKLRTVTCVIRVTCVISSLGSPNGLIFIL